MFNDDYEIICVVAGYVLVITKFALHSLSILLDELFEQTLFRLDVSREQCVFSPAVPELSNRI